MFSDRDSTRTVVVGVRLDSQSKQLLTWAMVKVAQPGDRVLALHVASKPNLPESDSFAKDFDSVLAVYEGFCNLKQVRLELKVCFGSSIRKVLVREVKGLGPSKVILGVTKNSGVIGSFSTSIAKYCARKLPSECSVVAVNNGKVVFQRDSKEESESIKEKKALIVSNGDSQCFLRRKLHGSDSGSFRDSDLPSPSGSPHSNAAREGNEEDRLALIATQDGESLSGLSSPPDQESSDMGCSWPIIRRLVPNAVGTNNSDKYKCSVSQWAMRLPMRYSAAVVHPDHKKIASSAYETESTTSEIAMKLVEEENKRHLPEELEALSRNYKSKCRIFTYEELANATSHFSADNLVGKGGNSFVYKGHLPDGKVLAVKILNKSEDALKEFVVEVEMITALCHTNIISLSGFCLEKGKFLLVYDLLSRGSLETNLHGSKDKANILNWSERSKVAIGVAQALEYLHDNSNRQPVIHRDVKSSNILLSDDFEPQLSDFGLATWGSLASTHVTCSEVAGTFGYLAPEYFSIGKVNEKIDVYAFGVVLLELLSGKKPIEAEYPKNHKNLVMWAKSILHTGNYEPLLDSSLDSEHNKAQIERLTLAASLCIRRSPKLRPKMSRVVKLLKGDNDTVKWARLQFTSSSELEIVDEDAVACSSLKNIHSHLSLALLDVEDEMLSPISTCHSVDFITAHSSLEAYLQERWSHSPRLN